jgi:hypothetical protein
LAVADGRYSCLIKTHGLAKANTGSMFLFLEFDVVAFLEEDGSEQPLKPGRQAPTGRLQLYLTDAAFDNSLRDAKKIFGQFSSFGELDPGHPQGVSVVGKEFEFVAKNEQYNGKTQTKWMLPFAVEAKVKRLTGADIDNLDARLNGMTGGGRSPALSDPPDDMPY